MALDVLDGLVTLPARGDRPHDGGYDNDRDDDPDPHTTACWHGDLPRDMVADQEELVGANVSPT